MVSDCRLSPKAEIELLGLFHNSYQGDSRGAEDFLTLRYNYRIYIARCETGKKTGKAPERLEEDFIDIPDLAQTFVVTCALLNIPFRFTGLQSLKIKETDRIAALRAELKKLGYVIEEENDLEFDPKEAILHHEEGVDLIPSNKLLAGMDMSLFTVEDREKVLKEYLELLKDEYDYILIDCMPSLGMLTLNALSAADSVLIPVQPQYYAADGLMELLKVVKGIHQRFNPDLQIEGILFTMDNCRYNNAKRNKQAIKTTYGSDIRIFEQTIPRTESLAETASEGVSIFAYDGKSKGADSYLELVQEVLKHA